VAAVVQAPGCTQKVALHYIPCPLHDLAVPQGMAGRNSNTRELSCRFTACHTSPMSVFMKRQSRCGTWSRPPLSASCPSTSEVPTAVAAHLLCNAGSPDHRSTAVPHWGQIMYCLLGAVLSMAIAVCAGDPVPHSTRPRMLCRPCTLCMYCHMTCRHGSQTITCGHAAHATSQMLSVAWCTSQKAQCANQPGSYLVQHTYSKLDRVIPAGTCQVRGCAVSPLILKSSRVVRQPNRAQSICVPLRRPFRPDHTIRSMSRRCGVSAFFIIFII